MLDANQNINTYIAHKQKSEVNFFSFNFIIFPDSTKLNNESEINKQNARLYRLNSEHTQIER